ncbi:MAG: glycoside hydrolase family 1 protein [Anaerolineae bacterium]
MTLPTDKLAFPEGFLWGTATSSHQVEGGNTQNDWWAWEQLPGHIADGSCSGAASDWWHMAEADLATAAELGQNAHRLSVEWSRLEPAEGAWDESAVARYREILGAMRALGITPMITLHHFTFPLWLAERGGWLNGRAVAWFGRFAERCVDAFGDLCTLWCTINEPMVYILNGYLLGTWPPGRGGVGAMLHGLRQMARAHAAAYHVIHRRQEDAQVGYAKHLRLFRPASPSSRAERALIGVADQLFNDAALEAFATGALLPPFGLDRRRPGRAPLLDFIGLNYYCRDMLSLDLRRRPKEWLRLTLNPESPYSLEGWGEIYPQGLYEAIQRVAAFQVPIHVTEFGLPDNTDTMRPRLLVEHVEALYRAVRDGYPVKGAFFWSLVDNYEWSAGWSARFGLIALDPATQARRLTRSAGIHAAIARANGLERAVVAEAAPERVVQWFGAAEPLSF